MLRFFFCLPCVLLPGTGSSLNWKGTSIIKRPVSDRYSSWQSYLPVPHQNHCQPLALSAPPVPTSADAGVIHCCHPDHTQPWCSALRYIAVGPLTSGYLHFIQSHLGGELRGSTPCPRKWSVRAQLSMLTGCHVPGGSWPCLSLLGHLNLFDVNHFIRPQNGITQLPTCAAYGLPLSRLHRDPD